MSCGLLEENGVKLLLLETKRDSFFGLSVGERGRRTRSGRQHVGPYFCRAVDLHRGA